MQWWRFKKKPSSYINIMYRSENNVYSKGTFGKYACIFPFWFLQTCAALQNFYTIFGSYCKVEISNDFYQVGCFLLRTTRVNNDNNSKVNEQGCRQRKVMISQQVGGVNSASREKINNAHGPPLTSAFISHSKQLKGFEFPNQMWSESLVLMCYK